jgi:hypothetical protein
MLPRVLPRHGLSAASRTDRPSGCRCSFGPTLARVAGSSCVCHAARIAPRPVCPQAAAYIRRAGYGSSRTPAPPDLSRNNAGFFSRTRGCFRGVRVGNFSTGENPWKEGQFSTGPTGSSGRWSAIFVPRTGSKVGPSNGPILYRRSPETVLHRDVQRREHERLGQRTQEPFQRSLLRDHLELSVPALAVGMLCRW